MCGLIPCPYNIMYVCASMSCVCHFGKNEKEIGLQKGYPSVWKGGYNLD